MGGISTAEAQSSTVNTPTTSWPWKTIFTASVGVGVGVEVGVGVDVGVEVGVDVGEGVGFEEGVGDCSTSDFPVGEVPFTFPCFALSGFFPQAQTKQAQSTATVTNPIQPLNFIFFIRSFHAACHFPRRIRHSQMKYLYGYNFSKSQKKSQTSYNYFF